MNPPAAPPPVALTIAGSDSSAGAGMQADLKTFSAHGLHGVCAVTAVVAEIPGEVAAWEAVAPGLLQRQLEVLGRGFPLAASKTGMLANAALAEAAGDFLESIGPGVPLVVDPVMVASSGDKLLEEAAIEVYRRRLLPLAAVATPNLAETAVLLDLEVAAARDMDMEEAAREFTARYDCPVLVKGGHWQDGEEAVDLLWDGREAIRLVAERVQGVDTHGTGCTLSAAIAAHLALGIPLADAAGRAKRYITRAIRQAHCWSRPAAIRALNHFPEAVG